MAWITPLERMVFVSDRNTERRLRYALDKAGYLLCKSGVKNINPDNLGDYMIIDKYGNCVVAGSRFEYTLENVEDWLTNG